MLFLVVVPAIQINFLIRADRTARLTAEAAKQSAEIAGSQVGIAQSTLEAMRQRTERQLGAYIFGYTGAISVVSSAPGASRFLHVTAHLKNFGQTQPPTIGIG